MSEEQKDIIQVPEVKKIFNSKLPEAIKEYNRQYYLKNKEKKLNDAKTDIFCAICNKNIHKSSLQRHIKSPKHLNNVKKNIPVNN